MKSNLLTASRMRSYRDCARKHDLAYQQGWRATRASEALRFGTLIHKGLEARWTCVQRGIGSDQTIAYVLDRISGEGIDAVEQIKAEEILIAYEARWPNDELDYEVLAVEPTFNAPLLNPETMALSKTWRLGGAIDSVLRRRDATKRVLVREFKTTSEAIDSDADLYWERLTMDPQLSIYVIGAETLGYVVDECLYDVVRKPLLRLSEVPVVDDEGVKVVVDANGERVRTKDGKKWRQTGDKDAGYTLTTRPETPEEFRMRLREELAGNPDKYFQRKPIPRSNSQLQDFLFDAWQIGKQIREAEIAGRAPRNPDACLRFGQRCSYFDICSTGLDPAHAPDQYTRLENVHPELQREETNATS